MKILTTMILAALVIVVPCGAQAAKGTVVLRVSGCDYYLVATSSGLALLEWYGGNDPDVGDYIVGDFEDYGMKDIFNVTADEETTVWVEDYLLSEDDALEQLKEQCGIEDEEELDDE